MIIPAKLLDWAVEKGGGTIVGGFVGGAIFEGVVLYLHLRGVKGEVLDHVRNIGYLGLAGLTAGLIWMRSKKNATIATEAKAIAVEAAANATLAAEAQSGHVLPPSTIPEVEQATTAKRRLSTGVKIR